MYNPPRYKNDDFYKSADLIQDAPLSVMLSVYGNNQLFVSHIPLIMLQKNSDYYLVGHIAKQNPHYQILLKNPELKVVFNGPNCYISPNWYLSGQDVPTWNYAILHVDGELSFLNSYEETLSSLELLTEYFEKTNEAWKFSLPNDLKDQNVLQAAITAFEIKINKIESKFKLSQNRSELDQQNIIANLLEVGEPQGIKVAGLMKKK